ncbi:MAG: hypothetical protein ABI286_03970 [Edaphobacter sp.]
MRALSLRVLFIAATFTASVTAQMHKVAKPQQVVRAIGVYEWTGDFAKPAASRLIPVSLYIDGQFQDAGIYIARPIPFALLPGNLYILQAAGIDKGTLDLTYARHLQAVAPTGDLAYDDGWFGYGSVKPLAVPKRSTLKPSKTLPVLVASNDTNRPHFGSKPTNDSTTATDKPASTASSDDPDRPTMKRRTPAATDSSGTATTSTTTTPSTGSTPADDPDRPTMKRRDTTPDAASANSGDNPAPTDDPDRPTLKRHTPEDAKKAQLNDSGSATGVDALNNDPNRPNLHYGKPVSAMNEADLPRLTGLPPNLHQMIAVSDAVNRDPHPFALAWDDDEQHKAILQKMQTMARTQLAAYGSTPPTAPAATAATHPKRKTTASARSHHAAPIPPSISLLDEQLKAYTLSYGGAATYVYSAHTAGTGAALRYVTVVAQDDGLGNIKPAIQSVTDAAHLDRTPRMQFVDVVDADASNRASLLFELRSQNVRQFALYRVIASHSEQIFLTGTTQ